MRILFAPAIVAVLLCAGCIVTTNTGPTQYDSRAFERQDAKQLRLELHMGAGDLRVGTGTSKLLQSYFTYNVESWKPEIRESRTGESADITISEPSGTHAHAGNVKYEWDLRLPEDVPLDLITHFGAGQARLDLGALTLQHVEVHMGVGQLQMDLRGSPKQSYNVDVHGGVGQATIWLPGSVGVYAEAHGGIGEISVHGLRKVGGHYENDAYDSAKTRVHVTVNGGIGQITLNGE